MPVLKKLSMPVLGLSGLAARMGEWIKTIHFLEVFQVYEITENGDSYIMEILL